MPILEWAHSGGGANRCIDVDCAVPRATVENAAAFLDVDARVRGGMATAQPVAVGDGGVQNMATSVSCRSPYDVDDNTKTSWQQECSRRNCPGIHRPERLIPEGSSTNQTEERAEKKRRVE